MPRLEDLFPGWARIWRRESARAEKLDYVRELREHRARGNEYLPHLQLDPDVRQCLALYPEMREAEAGRTDLPIQSAYQAHAQVIQTFTPIVHRAFWARWLYLERALEVASDSGDLLFGAVVLRTMVEDVWALRELGGLESGVVLLDHQGARPEDFRRIRSHGDLLWTRFLPPDARRANLPDSSAPEPFSGGGPDDEHLRVVFQRLNDYVHPNYGSHLLSLFPERSVAADALLDAFIAIYEAFFKLSWTQSIVSRPSTSLPPLAARSWPEEVHFLRYKTLPEIQRHRADRGLAHRSEDPAPNVLRWIEREEDGYDLMFKVLPDWFQPIRDLAEVVFGNRPTDAEMAGLLRERSDLGFPPRNEEILLFTGARDLAFVLERDFPAGAPSRETSPTEWLRFAETAISLALTTTQHKMTLLRVALVRQLNASNPLGSILAMRSLVEHQAVAIYLGRRLDRGWEDVGKRSSSGTLPTEWLGRMEHDIARFLAGTKGTGEEHTTWKTEWANAGLDEALNLRSAIEQGLKPDQVLEYLYDFGSDVLSGRKARGFELCPPTDATYVWANLSRALLALNDLTSMDAQLDIIAAAARVSFAMGTLRRAMEQRNVDWAQIIRTALAPKQRLKQGRDYSGDGTDSTPYIFASGLPYHDAFARLCDQLALDKQRRRLRVDPDGRMLDVVPGAEREHFFLVPKDLLLYG